MVSDFKGRFGISSAQRLQAAPIPGEDFPSLIA